MATYEMLWDCASCGTKKLLGKTHRHCPSCGNVQDPDARYFPRDEDRVLVEDHVFHGVDWQCERCDTPNSAAASHCVNCGDRRDGVEEDVRLQADPDEAPASPPPPRSAGTGRTAVVVVLVLALVLCAGLLVGSLFWTAPTTVTVQGHSWERSVRVEKLAPRSDGAWCDRTPSDAYSVSRSRKQRSTKKIPDGETCRTVNKDNGDGTFSTRQKCTTKYRSEPVYDDLCSFTVDRWGHERTEVAEGRGRSPAPAWPRVQVDDCRRLGCTRIAGRRASYWVHMVDGDGDAQSCDVSEATWGAMHEGSRWAARKRVVWDNLVCDGLQPEGGER